MAVQTDLPTTDILEVQQLLARYAVGMTKNAVDEVVDVFTDDGTYSAFGDTYRLDQFPELVAAAPKIGASSVMDWLAAAKLPALPLATAFGPICWFEPGRANRLNSRRGIRAPRESGIG